MKGKTETSERWLAWPPQDGHRATECAATRDPTFIASIGARQMARRAAARGARAPPLEGIRRARARGWRSRTRRQTEAWRAAEGPRHRAVRTAPAPDGTTPHYRRHTERPLERDTGWHTRKFSRPLTSVSADFEKFSDADRGVFKSGLRCSVLSGVLCSTLSRFLSPYSVSTLNSSSYVCSSMFYGNAIITFSLYFLCSEISEPKLT